MVTEMEAAVAKAVCGKPREAGGGPSRSRQQRRHSI